MSFCCSLLIKFVFLLVSLFSFICSSVSCGTRAFKSFDVTHCFKCNSSDDDLYQYICGDYEQQCNGYTLFDNVRLGEGICISDWCPKYLSTYIDMPKNKNISCENNAQACQNKVQTTLTIDSTTTFDVRSYVINKDTFVCLRINNIDNLDGVDIRNTKSDLIITSVQWNAKLLIHNASFGSKPIIAKYLLDKKISILLKVNCAFTTHNSCQASNSSAEKEYVTCTLQTHCMKNGVLINNEINEIVLFADIPEYVEKIAMSKIYVLFLICISIFAGILLNFMPCCFPMLSVKIYGIVNNKISRRDVVLQAVGSCLTFMSIACYTLLTKSMWGALMHQSSFVLLILLLLFVSALHFLYDISIQNKRMLTCISILFFVLLLYSKNVSVHRVVMLCLVMIIAYVLWMCLRFIRHKNVLRHDRGEKINVPVTNIMHGCISSINATMCAGPLIGTAIGAAINLPMSISLLIFLCISVGFVLPILLLTYVPVVRSLLPQQGEWLNKFKKINGIILIAACIWIIQILSTLIGQQVIFYISFTLSIMAIGYILLDSTSIISQSFATIIFCSSVYTILQMQTICNVCSKRQEILDYNKNVFDSVIASGGRLLITFTSSSCLNCKYNNLFFNNSNVQKFLQKHNITAMKCDMTKFDKDKETLLKMTGACSVPCNVLFRSAEKFTVLPTILQAHDIKNNKYWE